MTHVPNDPILPSPWPPAGRIDLRSFVRNLAIVPGDPGPTTGEYRRTCVQLEPQPVRIRATPLEVGGWLDGVQSRALLGRLEGHRDVSIAYLAAGTVLDKKILALEERLSVVCSALDEARVRAALEGVPVVAVDELTPWGIALATDEWIDATRRSLEVQAIVNAPATAGRVVVVDGPLPHVERTDIVGVVKQALDTPWISDPSLLPELGGWRSPALRLPAGSVREKDRLTAYVRLRDADGHHSWGWSLIRIETPAARGVDGLDAAAAMAYFHRQPLGSPDPRASVQLGEMWLAEQCLRARSPLALEVLG